MEVCIYELGSQNDAVRCVEITGQSKAVMHLFYTNIQQEHYPVEKKQRMLVRCALKRGCWFELV